jgi:hypothetical protein
MNFKHLLFFSVIIPFTIRAQPYFDLGGYSFVKGPVQTENDRKETSVFSHAAFLNIPIKSDSAFTIFTPAFENFNLRIKDLPAFNCYSYRFALTRIQKWKNNWQTAFVIHARSNSDQQIFRKPNYQAGGAVIFYKKINERFRYRFGLYYNREFFGNFFVPLLGINYTVTDRWKIYGLLPNNLSFNYSLSKMIHSGLTLSLITSSYRLTENKYLRFEEKQLRFYLHFIFAKRNVFFAEAGHSFFRNAKLGTGFLSRNGEHDLFISDSILLRFGYAYRIFE